MIRSVFRVTGLSASIVRKNVPSLVRAYGPLKEKIRAKIPAVQAEAKELKSKHGAKVLGNCTVDQAIGGMRDVWCMVYDTSLLDAQEGIRFRGYSIPELQKMLPAFKEGGEPLPEGLFWLLLTGEIPTKAELDGFTRDLQARAALPDWVTKAQLGLPTDLHPMTQLCAGANFLQHDSKFAAAYQGGAKKTELWEHAYEDTLDLIGKMPALCSNIYRHSYHGGKLIAPDPALDWSGNFARMLGYESGEFAELLRLYLTIHSDHEGGNVSAHTVHLVGSALSDPYLAFSAGMAGLAGPLHGLANQEVLNWTLDFQKMIGKWDPTDDEVEKALWDTLNAGRVIPGFGHAVLRKTDPRYTCQREFALKHLPDDPLFKLVGQIYKIAPPVLTKHGKTKNPWPNVDAHSGCLLQYYGMKEQAFYTVLFGASRWLGTGAQLIWSRALGFPIERPKSVTLQWIKENAAKLK